MSQQDSPISVMDKQQQTVENQQIGNDPRQHELTQVHQKQNDEHHDQSQLNDLKDTHNEQNKIEQTNQQKSLELPVIKADLIYRKKSELLGNLKLKTYDVNQDEDDGQSNEPTANQRIITIQADQDQSINPVQKKQQEYISEGKQNSEEQPIQKQETHQNSQQIPVSDQKTQEKQNEKHQEAQQQNKNPQFEQQEHKKQVNLNQSKQLPVENNLQVVEQKCNVQNEQKKLDNIEVKSQGNEQESIKVDQCKQAPLSVVQDENVLTMNQKHKEQKQDNLDNQIHRDQQRISGNNQQKQEQQKMDQQVQGQSKALINEQVPIQVQQAELREEKQQPSKKEQLLEPQIRVHMVNSVLSQPAKQQDKHQFQDKDQDKHQDQAKQQDESIKDSVLNREQKKQNQGEKSNIELPGSNQQKLEQIVQTKNQQQLYPEGNEGNQQKQNKLTDQQPKINITDQQPKINATSQQPLNAPNQQLSVKEHDEQHGQEEHNNQEDNNKLPQLNQQPQQSSNHQSQQQHQAQRQQQLVHNQNLKQNHQPLKENQSQPVKNQLAQHELIIIAGSLNTQIDFKQPLINLLQGVLVNQAQSLNNNTQEHEINKNTQEHEQKQQQQQQQQSNKQQKDQEKLTNQLIQDVPTITIHESLPKQQIDFRNSQIIIHSIQSQQPQLTPQIQSNTQPKAQKIQSISSQLLSQKYQPSQSHKQPIINQPSTPLISVKKVQQQPKQLQQKPHITKATSWKSRKLQKPTQPINQPQKHVVRNKSLHELVVNIHKTQKDPVKLPLHRPSNSQRKIRGNSPNLNRLKHNIGLDSKIIDLTVGEIFEQRHKRNDEMKSMLLKEIQTLREQIHVYEHQDNTNVFQTDQRQSRQPTNQLFQSPSKVFRNKNRIYSAIKQQEGFKPSFATQRQQHFNQVSYSDKKKPLYHTQRTHKLPLITPGQTPPLQYPQDEPSQNFSAFNQGPSAYLHQQLMLSSPQKRDSICGKIVRKQNHDTLRNSRAVNQSDLNESKFSKTVNGSQQSFVQQLSSGEVLESPSKVTQGSRLNQYSDKRASSVNKKRIGAIINLKEAAMKPRKQLMESQVNAPSSQDLQLIPLPEKFIKQLDWQSLKQQSWSQLYTHFDQQFNSVIQKTTNLPFPTSQSTQQELVHFAHLTFFTFGINIQSEDCLLNIKRYKNCIVFNLTHTDTIIYHFEGNKVYFGGWNGQAKEGWGLEITDSHVFKGQFANSKKNGIGVMRAKKLPTQKDQLTTENNHHKFVYYFGSWQNNLKHNFGIQLEFTHNNAIEYQGDWLIGKKTGQGALRIYQRKTQQVVQTYEGTFLNGKKQGLGRQRFLNGDTYQGQYSQNKFQGKGKYTWNNGACYVGNFTQGIRQGKGQWFSDSTDAQVLQNPKANTPPNSKLKGDYYKGEYKNNKKHGFGIYRWKNGTIYEGQFENDEKVGEGTLIVENQVVYNGQAKVKAVVN